MKSALMNPLHNKYQKPELWKLQDTYFTTRDKTFKSFLGLYSESMYLQPPDDNRSCYLAEI